MCHMGVQFVWIWLTPLPTNNLRTVSWQVAFCPTYPATVQIWTMQLSSNTIATVQGQSWIIIISSITWGHVFVVIITAMSLWAILTFIICTHCLFMDIKCVRFAHICLLFPTSNYIIYSLFQSNFLLFVLQLPTVQHISICLIKHSLSLPKFLIYVRDPIFITGWVLRDFYLSITFIWFLSIWDWMRRQYWRVWLVSLSLAICICTVGASSVSLTYKCFECKRVIPSHTFTLRSNF